MQRGGQDAAHVPFSARRAATASTSARRSTTTARARPRVSWSTFSTFARATGSNSRRCAIASGEGVVIVRSASPRPSASSSFETRLAACARSDWGAPPQVSPQLAAELSDSDLCELYEDEVSEFVSSAIQSDPSRFRAWDDIDAISSQTMLDEAYCYEVVLKGDAPSARIDFRALVTVSVTPTYDREEAASMNFPGRAVGHIDQDGMSLTEFTVDVSSFDD